MSGKQVIGYARVSTREQSLDGQVQALRDYGCTKLFSEKITGTNTTRQALNDMMAYVREGDILVVTKLDRLARSSIDLGRLAEQLQEKGVDLVVLDQKIDTTSAAGKLMFTMIGAFAEFERDLIYERCQAGIAKARASGVQFGRPKKLSDTQVLELCREYAQGLIGKSALAEKYGISRPTMYRVVKQTAQIVGNV